MITEPSFSDSKILNVEANPKLLKDASLFTILLAFHRHTLMFSQLEAGLLSFLWSICWGVEVAERVEVESVTGGVDMSTSLSSDTLANITLSTIYVLLQILICLRL